MVQCIAKVKSGRQCKRLAMPSKRYCSVHRDKIDWSRVIATVGGSAIGHILVPGLGGTIIGGLAGNLVDRHVEENKTMAKRVFVSFDFDKDKFLKDGVIGQSKYPDSPFAISDWSLKEEQEQANWKAMARARIKRSEIVLVMVGTETHQAPGVLAEVNIARDEDIKIVQIKGYPDKNCPHVPNAGTMYRWTWDNLKNLLS